MIGISSNANANRDFIDQLNYSMNQAGAIGARSPAVQDSIMRGARSYQSGNSTDHPVYDNGKWVSSLSGQPWHGSYTNANGATTYYSNGAQVSSQADVGAKSAAAPDFSVTKTQKNPTISGEVDQLNTDVNNPNGLLSKSFTDYLNEARQAAGLETQALNTGLAKLDTSGTAATINNAATQGARRVNSANANLTGTQNEILGNESGATRNYIGATKSNLGDLYDNSGQSNANIANINRDYSGTQNNIMGGRANSTGAYDTGVASRFNTLTGQTGAVDQNLLNNNSDYAGAQGKVLGDIGNLNTSYNDQQQKQITDLKTNLDQNLADYATKTRAVADQAYNQAQKQIALYHLGTGTPTSGSGNLDNRYIRAYSQINVPLEQDLANRNIAETNQMYGLTSGLARENYGNVLSQYNTGMNLNTDIANRNNSLQQFIDSQNYRNYNAGQQAGQDVYNADMNLYGLQSGLASDLANRNLTAQQYADTLAARNYSASDYANRDILSANTALNQMGAGFAQDQAGRETAAAQSQQNTAIQNAQIIQRLNEETAGMPLAMIQQYLAAQRVPLDVAQQFINQRIANLGGVMNLDQNANWYTVSTPYQNNAPQYGYYPTTVPNRRYTTGTGVSNAGPSVNGINLGNIGDVSEQQARDFLGRQNQPSNLQYTTSGGVINPGVPRRYDGPAPRTVPLTSTGASLPQGDWASTLQRVPGGTDTYQDPANGNLYKLYNGQIYPYDAKI